jgi:hypothetical protein
LTQLRGRRTVKVGHHREETPMCYRKELDRVTQEQTPGVRFVDRGFSTALVRGGAIAAVVALLYILS